MLPAPGNNAWVITITGLCALLPQVSSDPGSSVLLCVRAYSGRMVKVAELWRVWLLLCLLEKGGRADSREIWQWVISPRHLVQNHLLYAPMAFEDEKHHGPRGLRRIPHSPTQARPQESNGRCLGPELQFCHFSSCVLASPWFQEIMVICVFYQLNVSGNLYFWYPHSISKIWSWRTWTENMRLWYNYFVVLFFFLPRWGPYLNSLEILDGWIGGWADINISF